MNYSKKIAERNALWALKKWIRAMIIADKGLID